MKLYQETRLQALMLVSSLLGCATALALIVAGLIKQEMLYLLYAGADIVIVYLIIVFGQRWTQRTMARCQKIREGGGDKADLEWLKTRKK